MSTVRNFMSTVWEEGSAIRLITSKLDDETYEGTWASAPEGVVVYADHALDGTSVTFHGGPVGGDPHGHPVQLIFWGDWWNSPDGAARRGLFEQRVQDLLRTPYFSELTQYGVAHAPVWRGSMTVTRPTPPGMVTTSQAMQATLDLIDDLIDDDKLPDPDDGPRFANIVMMPRGFSINDPVTPSNGAHWWDYDYNFPFDRDNYWAGWVRYFDPVNGEDPEDTLRTFSHELVELLTDPEGDGWHTEKSGGTNEVSDAGRSSGSYQTAVVGGARVQSYWSEARRRTVIPVEPHWRAQISAKVEETDRRDLDRGEFTPDEAGGLTFCVENRAYNWWTYEIDQRATLTLRTHLFHTPLASWQINGVMVNGTGSMQFNTNVDGFSGRDPFTFATVVTVGYDARPDRLVVDIRGARGSFELPISARVRDREVKGKVESEPVAVPRIAIGVTGAELVLDPEYERQMEACMKELLRPYIEQKTPFGIPVPGDPPDPGWGVLVNTLPGYAKQAAYQRTRDVERAIRAAYAMQPQEQAQAFVQSLGQDLHLLGPRISVEDLHSTITDRLNETFNEHAVPVRPADVVDGGFVPGQPDDLGRLVDAHQAWRSAQDQLRSAVREALVAGNSWTSIADALQMPEDAVRRLGG